MQLFYHEIGKIGAFRQESVYIICYNFILRVEKRKKKKLPTWFKSKHLVLNWVDNLFFLFLTGTIKFEHIGQESIYTICSNFFDKPEKYIYLRHDEQK